MIKNLFSFFLAGLLLASCNSNNKKTASSEENTERIPIQGTEQIQQISEVISRFARAYLSQDNQKVNALIHPDYGIAVIFRPGAMDDFQLVDSLDFNAAVPEYFPYPTFTNDKVLTFETLPEFDCGTVKWNKLGFFCDTVAGSTTHKLQTIVKFQQEFNERKYDDAQQNISHLEDGSYRVILAQSSDDYLVFHVKQFENTWYVTMLDRSYASCDA